MGKRTFAALGLAALALAAIGAGVLTAGESISRSSISSGGGTGMSAEGLELSGALGQPVAGAVTTGTLGLCSGFWCGGSQGGKVFLPLVMCGYAGGIFGFGDAPGECATAAQISVGTAYREDFDFENDNDWYAFQAVAGQTYTIWTYDLEYRADTYIYLHDPDCGIHPITDDDDGGPGFGSKIVWTAPVDGTYRVDVRSRDYTVYGADTGYTVQVALGELTGSTPDVAGGGGKPAPPPTPAPGGRR